MVDMRTAGSGTVTSIDYRTVLRPDSYIYEYSVFVEAAYYSCSTVAE